MTNTDQMIELRLVSISYRGIGRNFEMGLHQFVSIAVVYDVAIHGRLLAIVRERDVPPPTEGGSF